MNNREKSLSFTSGAIAIFCFMSSCNTAPPAVKIEANEQSTPVSSSAPSSGSTLVQFASSSDENGIAQWLVRAITQNCNKAVHTVTNRTMANQGQKFRETYNVSFRNSMFYFFRKSNDADNGSSMSEESFEIPIDKISEVKADSMSWGGNDVKHIEIWTKGDDIVAQYQNYNTGESHNYSTSLLNMHFDCDWPTTVAIRDRLLSLRDLKR